MSNQRFHEILRDFDGKTVDFDTIVRCFGHLNVAMELCSKGADPLCADPAGYTPLHFACRWDQVFHGEIMIFPSIFDCKMMIF